MNEQHFDVLVIGGGHAGIEAAHASARMGVQTLLITQNLDTLGKLSCNPAIGGIGKTHLVKEIDALGGVMAKIADDSTLHSRTLNQSKGAAVWALRVQCDKIRYQEAASWYIQTPNLSLFQGEVSNLWLDKGKLLGVILKDQSVIFGKQVVLTAGTFLRGVMHYGHHTEKGGRASEKEVNSLTESLESIGLKSFRLKTGTPPRVDKRSLDFSKMEVQPSEQPSSGLSYFGKRRNKPHALNCYLSETTEKTHEIIKENLHLSAMYSGKIQSQGPRYCPSIEDKVTRFADKKSHLVFIEPEGLQSFEVYPNGISTSLPPNIQLDWIQTLKGFDSAKITRFGYAIEYDCFDPQMLQLTLESKALKGLYLAGQINGTTGYEEAAAQGLLAGANAALASCGKEPFFAKRGESYLGVMVDDLTRHGVSEPYRMFTSRSEHRLYLRQDNADFRLCQKAHELSLLDETQYKQFLTKRERVSLYQKKLQKSISNSLKEALALQQKTSYWQLLKSPQYPLKTLQEHFPLEDEENKAEDWLIFLCATESKYEGYIKRAQEMLQKQGDENLELPFDFDYQALSSLSSEIKERLQKQKPQTLAQASRLEGITPSAIEILRIYLRLQSKQRNKL